MARQLPGVPAAVQPQQPITAADWNDFVYCVAFNIHPPAAMLLQNTAQSINPSTATKVTYDTAARDSDAGHDSTANSTRYTVQIPGLYQVMVMGLVPGSTAAGNERYIAITVNGTAIWSMEIAATSSWNYAAADIPLNTGDYVETQLFQDSGAAQNTSAGSGGQLCQMLLIWVGR